MKKNTLLWQIVSVLVCLAAVVFLILPGIGENLHSAVYDFPEEFIGVEEDAAWIVPLREALQEYQLELQYPESVWFGGTFNIKVSFIPREEITDPLQAMDEIEPFIVESKLVMDDVAADPGKNVLVPVQLPHAMFLQYEISPQNSGDKKGNIWISLYPTSEDGGPVPVFVIPVEIQMHSFLGLKTSIWQVIWSCLGAGGIVVLFNTGRKKE